LDLARRKEFDGNNMFKLKWESEDVLKRGIGVKVFRKIIKALWKQQEYKLLMGYTNPYTPMREKSLYIFLLRGKKKEKIYGSSEVY